MAKLLGIVGFSGSGKSTSLRNMPHEETFIVSPSKAELPIPGFKKKYEKTDKPSQGGNFFQSNQLQLIPKIVKTVSEKRPDIKYLVIEDITHYFNAVTLSDEFRSKSGGNAAWARWGDFGAAVMNALFRNNEQYREDLWIITMFHPETSMTPEGERLKIKTPGNLLEREVDIPSYYNNLLYTKVEPVNRAEPQPASARYKFVTNDDGYAPAKTSFGVFDDLYIENDLYNVIQAIEAFDN